MSSTNYNSQARIGVVADFQLDFKIVLLEMKDENECSANQT